MALGSDMYFCEAVALFREDHGDITLEAALPCEDQAAKWSERQRNRYFKLIQQCDTETYVSRKYTPDCMMRRNKYMVDNSSVLIAVYDGRSAGRADGRLRRSERFGDYTDKTVKIRVSARGIHPGLLSYF